MSDRVCKLIPDQISFWSDIFPDKFWTVISGSDSVKLHLQIGKIIIWLFKILYNLIGW
jgi:hypothetical protein